MVCLSNDDNSHQVAATLYSWSTAETLMRAARKRSLPNIPQSLQD